jgi:hypothetical protein
MTKISNYEDFKKFKVDVPQFINDYNAHTTNKITAKKTLVSKKKIALCSFIYLFMKDLKMDYDKRRIRKISGGTSVSSVSASSGIADLQQGNYQENAKNFFYWFPRQADYTNTTYTTDMTWNKWGYPDTTNFVRGNI